jgi:hypothetical protein
MNIKSARLSASAIKVALMLVVATLAVNASYPTACVDGKAKKPTIDDITSGYVDTTTCLSPCAQSSCKKYNMANAGSSGKICKPLGYNESGKCHYVLNTDGIGSVVDGTCNTDCGCIAT